MKKSYLVTILSIITILVVFQNAYAGEMDQIKATSYLLMDQKTGQVLCEKNFNKRIYPASTTKIMTAIIALENCRLNQKFLASKNAIDKIGKDGMNIGISQGEILTADDLLKATLISSANEAANILSEGVLTDYKTYIDAMNSKAKELGAVSTNYVNPTGMYDENHYTTALDLAVQGRYAMNIPKFRSIVKSESYKLPPTNIRKVWSELVTKNTFLRFYKESKYYTQITGIKTGYIEESKHNIVASAKDDKNNEFIAVIIGAGTLTKRDEYTEILLEYGFENYSKTELVQKYSIVGNEINIKDARGDKRVSLLAKEELKAFMPNDRSKWGLEKEEIIEDNISAPVKKGGKMGELVYKSNGILVGRVDLLASESVEKSSTLKRFVSANKSNNIVIIVVVILLLVWLISFGNRTSTKINKQNKKSIGKK